VESLLAVHAPELEKRGRRSATRCSTYNPLPTSLQKYFSPFNVFRYIHRSPTVYASLTAMFLALVFRAVADPQACARCRLAQYIREEGPQKPSEKKAGTSDHGRRADCPFHRGTHAAVGRSNKWIRTADAVRACWRSRPSDLSMTMRRSRSSAISGLTSKSKFLLQIFVSSIVGIGLLVFFAHAQRFIPPELMIPFLKGACIPDLVRPFAPEVAAPVARWRFVAISF